MAYNIRRIGNFANSVNSVGQRRPPPASNFVSGGQMTRQAAASQQNKGQQQNKPFQQPQQQQQQNPPQQQQPNKNTPQQQLQQKQGIPQQIKPGVQQPPQGQAQTQLQQQPPKQVPPPQAQNKPVQQQAPVPPPQQQQKPSPAQQQNLLQKSAEQLIAQQQPPTLKNESDESQTNMITNPEGEMLPMKPKPFWMKRATGRISKAEKMRKRNLRLRKMLQPKNALMVLNELVGSTSYNVQEVRAMGFDDVFKAAIEVDGVEHLGSGKSKVGAKTAAAEAAIKHIVLKKIHAFNQSLLSGTQTEDGQTEFTNEVIEKMEEGNAASEEQEQVSWSHIASFAIHKLFSSWDEDGNITDLISRSSSPGVIGFDALAKRSGSSMSGFQMLEHKPAKKLPENAVLMNPIMLLNQMHPNAKYEEIAKSGNPPHIQFTIKCTVLDQEFVGIGRNKKAARKQAAFAACTQVLGIQYPPEMLDDGAPKVPQIQTPMETL